MTDEIQGCLETTRAVRDNVCVICDENCSGAHGTKAEAKLGGIEGQKAGVDIHFEVRVCSSII